MNLKSKNNKGFTLLEVLIAVFVLSVGVVGSVDLILKSYSQVSSSEDKLTASYLAAEGLEIVRNIRDNNWKNNLNWDNGLDTTGTYRVDWLQNQLSTDTGENLLSSNLYGFNYFEGETSKFKRTIYLQKENDKISVKSEVTWKDRGREMKISAQEYLFNWYPTIE